jgi:hypothetical protein
VTGTCDRSSRKVAIEVATCDCGRRLLSGNKRKGVKMDVLYCSIRSIVLRTIDVLENNRIRHDTIRLRTCRLTESISSRSILQS